MYLHIGDNVAIPGRTVIGVFDLETTTVARDTRGFLEAAQRSGAVRDVCDDIPKAFVLTRRQAHKRYSTVKKTQKTDDIIYVTQLSTATIRKRVLAGV